MCSCNHSYNSNNRKDHTRRCCCNFLGSPWCFLVTSCKSCGAEAYIKSNINDNLSPRNFMYTCMSIICGLISWWKPYDYTKFLSMSYLIKTYFNMFISPYVMISDGVFSFNHSLPFPFGYSGAIVSRGVPPAINSVIPMLFIAPFFWIRYYKKSYLSSSLSSVTNRSKPYTSLGFF